MDVAHCNTIKGALEKVNISNNALLTAEAGKILADMLKTASTLKELDVSNNNWGPSYDLNGDGPGFAKEFAIGVRANGALTSLNVSNNNIGELVPPEGWSIKHKGYGNQKYVHADGREQKEAPEGMSPVGAIALADAIKNNGAMTSLDISANSLRAEGTKHIAAAIVECKYVFLPPPSVPL